MADKSQLLILDALTRAAAEPDGLPLVGGKTGLFAPSAAGKQAAQHSKQEGLVDVVRTQTRGKSTQEICVLTQKGLELLVEQASPQLVLEAFVKALQTREQQVNLLLGSARASQEHLQYLRLCAEKVLGQLYRSRQPEPLAVEKNGRHEVDNPALLLAYLARRREAGSLDDCPLPELYRHLRTNQPGLTIGQFHDLVRRLHDKRAVCLQPWTGPLYELPEPACALLVGHEVAYYVNLPEPQYPLRTSP